MIRITARTDGFRRCGIAHSAAPTEYPDQRFSKEQLEQLQREPQLIVELVAEQAAPGGQGQKPQKKNVTETVALVMAATTAEELAALGEGEDRKGVLDAIAKRSTELAVAGDKPEEPQESQTSQESQEQ